MVYQPGAFVSRLRGDKVPLGSSSTKTQKKKEFWKGNKTKTGEHDHRDEEVGFETKT